MRSVLREAWGWAPADRSRSQSVHEDSNVIQPVPTALARVPSGLRMAAITMVAAFAVAQNTTAAEFDCPAGASVDGMCLSYGLRPNLPVVSEGQRFASQPYGDSLTIIGVARTVMMRGEFSYERVPGLLVLRRAPLQFARRYEYSFPEACGGSRFTYFDAPGIKALGLHRGEQIVVDVLEGGGIFSAPRLWGLNDQVLNEVAPIKYVAGDARKGGDLGLYRGTYAVGYVAALSPQKVREHGEAYAAATRKAAQCLEPFPPETPRAQR